jgi:hypothetical protein
MHSPSYIGSPPSIGQRGATWTENVAQQLVGDSSGTAADIYTVDQLTFLTLHLFP